MASNDKSKSSDASTNPRGIPFAPFVDKVEDYVSSRTEVEGTLKSFQEMISKYHFMESNTQRRLEGLQEKIPDIRKTLEMVRFLGKRKSGSDPLETLFELNDTLFAKAEISPSNEANVMLSYPIEEAMVLLESKLSVAHQKSKECEEDIDFLREQITTMEVATARVYNWDVGQRRKEKKESGEKEDE